VEPRCTCGAVLPEDARFCHKCGKPQFEEDLARLDAVQPVSAQPVVVTAAPSTDGRATGIGLNNMRAVLVTMAVAALALFVLYFAALIAPPLGLFVLCGAGFAAARFYKARTTEPLSPGGGAVLGVMTGFWLFLVVVVCAAITSVYVASPTGREFLRSAMPKMPEVAKMLDDPHQFMMNLLLNLIPVFFIATISAAFGGMLAVRLSSRQRPR
jgi:hypothetical protein